MPKLIRETQGFVAAAVKDKKGRLKKKTVDNFDVYEFRLISNTILGADSWKSTDFTSVDFSSIVHLFDGIVLYANHDVSDIRNSIGIVKNPRYDETTSMNGKTVPSGVNAEVWVDTSTDFGKDVSRKVETGQIHSGSVKIQYQWQPSHGFDNIWGFYEKIGSVHEGSLVTRKVQKVVDVQEYSLVFYGADPYAKVINEGEIINPAHGQIQFLESIGMSADGSKPDAPQELGLVLEDLDYLLETAEEASTEPDAAPEGGVFEGSTDFAQEIKMRDEEISRVTTLLAETEAKVTELEAALERAKSDLQAELLTVKSEYKNLQESVADMQMKANAYDSRLSEVRESASAKIRLAALAKNEDISEYEQVISLVSMANEKQINAILKTFDISLQSNIDTTCGKCGSSVEAFRSSMPETDDEGNEKENHNFGFSLDEYAYMKRHGKAK